MKRFVSFSGNCLAVLLCSACVFGADSEPAPQLFTLDRVSIGDTSLDEVRALYGAAVATRLGKEDEADVQICYSAKAGGNASVSFESGVMGAMKYVTAYRLSRGKPADTC